MFANSANGDNWRLEPREIRVSVASTRESWGLRGFTGRRDTFHPKDVFPCRTQGQEQEQDPVRHTAGGATLSNRNPPH